MSGFKKLICLGEFSIQMDEEAYDLVTEIIQKGKEIRKQNRNKIPVSQIILRLLKPHLQDISDDLTLMLCPNDEEMLATYGWEVLCESPFEIQLKNEPSSAASGRAAEIIVESLRSDYKQWLVDQGHLSRLAEGDGNLDTNYDADLRERLEWYAKHLDGDLLAELEELGLRLYTRIRRSL